LCSKMALKTSLPILPNPEIATFTDTSFPYSKNK
jgi:hypothetical protein